MSKSQDERIAALEAKIADLERANALFKFQWLDRNAYGQRQYYAETPRTVLANTIICGGDGV